MPVTGSGGPTGPRPLAPARTDLDTTSTTALPEAPETKPAQGWTAQGTNIARADARPSGLTLLPEAPLAKPPNPIEAGMQRAIDRFSSRLDTTLHYDAMSAARGQPATRAGDPISDEQRTQLQSAATDFVKDIPIGAMAPDVAAAITDRLKAANLDTRDVASTKLGDLGAIGGDIAKDLIKDLKAASPAVYYSLAGAGAAAIGYTAWEKGSAGLSKLGVKPELKQKFFDDHLQLKLGAEWQSHFKDLQGTATVSGNMSVGDHGRLSASVTANTRTGVDKAELDYAYNNPDLHLSANAYVKVNHEGLESAGGRFTYNPSQDFSLSASIDHNFQTDRTTANAEATWKLDRNTDFALSARRDSTGASYVGVGVRIAF